MFNKLHRLFQLFRVLLFNRTSIVYTSIVRSKVLPDAAPEQWKIHKFGLSENKWRRLYGRSYWVTGAGTGYGHAIACILAAAGAQVF